jgi:nucleotide-binding universal stress UspA family protein
MYKNILIAIDGSETSIQALHEAINLAADQKAKLRLMHVIDHNLLEYARINIELYPFHQAMKETGQHILNITKTIAKCSEIEFDSRLVEMKKKHSRIEQSIVEEAKKWPADLIVIGSHGRRGVSHFILGSVAEGVIRIATTPVLVVREKNN